MNIDIHRTGKKIPDVKNSFTPQTLPDGTFGVTRSKQQEIEKAEKSSEDKEKKE